MSRIAIVPIILATIGAAMQPSSHAALFVHGAPVAVGHGSGEVALVDINHDAHLDLISKHLLRRVVDVRLGDGTGQFKPLAAGAIRFDYEPGAIALGDVDNDQHPDLVVARRDQAKEYVDVLPGTGNGGFRSASGGYVTNDSYRFYKPSIRLTDINEDGAVDIVTSNGRRNTIEILVGTGRTFGAPAVVRLEPGQDSHSFDVGDVDKDGHVDLVIVSRTEQEDSRMAVKYGNGKGGFTENSGTLAVLRGARLAALADLNADRRPDIVISHARNPILSVLLNSGKGTFAPAPGSPYALPTEAFAVLVADVNRDTKRDLIATIVQSEAQAFDSGLALLLGDGRTFVPASGSPLRTGRGAYDLALGDVNEDSRLDVAASSFEGSEISVLLGR